MKFIIASGLVLAVLSGCSFGKRSVITADVAPVVSAYGTHAKDPSPHYEPYSASGNQDYTILGDLYRIAKKTAGFKERGKMSWYGKKFHGYKTSNGEIYDMYLMTAAHKTLPLPSYARVTNLDNGKVAIVRINDRGPFHSGRIIDLSYEAASRLGMVRSGVANAKIEVISSIKCKPMKDLNREFRSYIIQVMASKGVENTHVLAKHFGQVLSVSSFIRKKNDFWKFFLGPFWNLEQAQGALIKTKALGYTSAFIKKYVGDNVDSTHRSLTQYCRL